MDVFLCGFCLAMKTREMKEKTSSWDKQKLTDQKWIRWVNANAIYNIAKNLYNI